MKTMRIVLWLLTLGAGLGFVFSYGLETIYKSRAQVVQLVRIDPKQESKFGPVTIDVGEPASVLVDDPGAFLKNKTATGLSMVDIDYLKERNMPLVRLESVQAVISLARVGCCVAAVIAIAGLFLLGRLTSPILIDEQN